MHVAARVLRGDRLAARHRPAVCGIVVVNATDKRLGPIGDIQFLGNELYVVESYEEEVSLVRTWIESRLSWMDGNIDEYTPSN